MMYLVFIFAGIVTVLGIYNYILAVNVRNGRLIVNLHPPRLSFLFHLFPFLALHALSLKCQHVILHLSMSRRVTESKWEVINLGLLLKTHVYFDVNNIFTSFLNALNQVKIFNKVVKS